MSITPRGMSVQEAYRLYREGNILVNRRYQRKLVWTISEKQKLIGSILIGYPIPLILLVERPQIHGSGKYEIIDGMQRLNAIFSFIENSFAFEEKYFDISQFTRAKQLANEDVFQPAPKDKLRLSIKECADLLDYQLAITIFSVMEEKDITEVFGRINSSGRRLSNQEKRQAGVTTPFADMVRKIAAELRGDVSGEILLLAQMPEISIESKTYSQGYKIQAEETFWCKQGILTVSQLRESEDEQMIADIAASILLEKPIPVGGEYLDNLYDRHTKEFAQLEESLAIYSADKLICEITRVVSVLIETIETCSSERNFLRKTVNPNSTNPIRTGFYTIFMAFFDLIVNQECSPHDPSGIIEVLQNIQENLNLSKHYKTAKAREKNIDKVKGLLQRYFVRKEPSVLSHGPGLARDFENSLNRSRLETPRYEFKQGLLRLSKDRSEDSKLIQNIVETICAIANLGPDSNGYLFIGVADSQKDAARIEELDKIAPIEFNGKYIVGIDREALVQNKELDEYKRGLVSKIRNSELSEPLKTQLYFDTILYKNRSVIRITIPAQKDVSFIGQKAFTRSGSSTVEVSGRQLLAVHKLF